MKSNEIRNLTVEELEQQLEETKRELFNLRIQQSTGQLEKPSRIREVRRDIARMNTIKTQLDQVEKTDG